MGYKQLASEERYIIARRRCEGRCAAEIARELGRHASTVSREVRRNLHQGNNYTWERAHEHAVARRRRSRKVLQFGARAWALVCRQLLEDWSPEQIALVFRRDGILQISHETIYRYVWRDKLGGGYLYKHLRHSVKRRRKRYRSNDSRGILRGKRGLEERPATANERQELGHVEVDLVHGAGSQACVLTVVDRKSRKVSIRKLRNKTMGEVNRALVILIQRERVRTVTVDNGSEYHDYERIERLTAVRFYFAAPYHSWERGTSENTNGLIRQYLPKRQSMAAVTQWECNAIARRLNRRPRKILGLLTPEDAHSQARSEAT